MYEVYPAVTSWTRTNTVTTAKVQALELDTPESCVTLFALDFYYKLLDLNFSEALRKIIHLDKFNYSIKF